MLIVYYTRDGHTATASNILADIWGKDDCTLFQVKESANRAGVFGYLRCCYDAIMSNPAELTSDAIDTASHDVVVVSAPVWAGKPAPAILSAIDTIDLAGKKVFAFVTAGSSPGWSLDKMKERIDARKGSCILTKTITTHAATWESVCKSEFESAVASLREKIKEEEEEKKEESE